MPENDSTTGQPDPDAGADPKPSETPDPNSTETPPADQPPAPDAPAAEDEQDKPDGETEDPVEKLRRIARHKEKETDTARRERDDALARATQAETDLAAAREAAAERDTIRGELETARTDLLRITIGTDKGLTVKQAMRLKGSTKEELTADADQFIRDNAAPNLDGRAPASPVDSDQLVEKLRRHNY